MQNELTEEEKIILKALGQGFTCKEIAKKFAIPLKKITQARKDIPVKLGAAGMAHAAYIAFRNGLID